MSQGGYHGQNGGGKNRRFIQTLNPGGGRASPDNKQIQKSNNLSPILKNGVYIDMGGDNRTTHGRRTTFATTVNSGFNNSSIH